MKRTNRKVSHRLFAGICQLPLHFLFRKNSEYRSIFKFNRTASLVSKSFCKVFKIRSWRPSFNKGRKEVTLRVGQRSRRREVSKILFTFGWENRTDTQNEHAHCFYRLKCRLFQFPDPLLASKWIRFVEPLLALPCTQCLSKRAY